MDDPYRTLGVPRTASPEAIRAAYRAAIRAAHPDAGGSQETASDLNAAYAILSDPTRRADWDRAHPAPGGPTRQASTARPPVRRPPPAAPAPRSSPGPAVVVVGVVAVALVGVLFATLRSGSDASDVGDSPFVIGLGDCVDLDAGLPTDVPCDGGRADGTVVAFGPSCPSGAELLAHGDAGICIDRIPSLVPEACVDIDGQVVTAVECGPAPDGIVSAVVPEPSACPLGTDAIATLDDGTYACIVTP